MANEPQKKSNFQEDLVLFKDVKVTAVNKVNDALGVGDHWEADLKIHGKTTQTVRCDEPHAKQLQAFMNDKQRLDMIATLALNPKTGGFQLGSIYSLNQEHIAKVFPDAKSDQVKLTMTTFGTEFTPQEVKKYQEKHQGREPRPQVRECSNGRMLVLGVVTLPHPQKGRDPQQVNVAMFMPKKSFDENMTNFFGKKTTRYGLTMPYQAVFGEKVKFEPAHKDENGKKLNAQLTLNVWPNNFALYSKDTMSVHFQESVQDNFLQNAGAEMPEPEAPSM